MTADDIALIESKLGITVPSDYEELVTDYPKDLPEIARGYDLLDNPVYVISENRSARQAPLFGTQWPEHFFVIGQDGAGGVFCIDRLQKQSPVFYFDHEDSSFHEVARNLRDWIPMIAKVHGG
jgi:hypothetical protein